MYDSPNSVSTVDDGPPGHTIHGTAVLGSSTPGYWGKVVAPLMRGPSRRRCKAVVSASVKQSSVTAPLHFGKSALASKSQAGGLAIRPSVTPSFASHLASTALNTLPSFACVSVGTDFMACWFARPFIITSLQRSVGAAAMMPSKSSGYLEADIIPWRPPVEQPSQYE